MAEIITANELVSGATIYLTADGSWVEDIDQARLFSDGETEERDAVVIKAKANNRLVSVDTEKAERDGGKVIADRLRERIRAEGPTAPRHDRQALGDDDHVSL